MADEQRMVIETIDLTKVQPITFCGTARMVDVPYVILVLGNDTGQAQVAIPDEMLPTLMAVLMDPQIVEVPPREGD